MANNRQPESKPNYSSSSDEEEEEEEASGSEDEQSSGSESQSDSDKQQPKKNLIPPPKSTTKPPPPDLSSESDESGSDTDSDSPPKKPAAVDPNIKPISSKPMERDESVNPELKLAKKSGSKPSSTPPPAKAKRPPPAPATSGEKDAKKPKKAPAPVTAPATEDDSKKQLFQRLWSEDDEIVILQGMIDYKTERNGESPVADMGAFHEYIKKSLHVDVSRAQLVDKVRRLKKKYVNNASREKNGKDRSFSKSHEQKGYELSKLIWGANNNSYNIENKKSQSQKNGNASTSAGVTVAIASAKSNGVDDNVVSVLNNEKSYDINRFVRYGSSDGPVLQEEIVKGGMELVEGSKREELEEKWKELKKQELELYVKRMDLIKEQTLVVLEAINSSGN